MKKFIVGNLLLLSIGCSSLKEVAFKNPIDTTTKKINIQKKMIYSIDEMGVYVSNDFDGARLNGVEKVNDSVIKIVSKPENRPINNSAYYSFKIWSKKQTSIYIQFDYPKEFNHRYTPKIKKISTNWNKLDSTNVYKRKGITFIKLNINKDITWVSAQELVTSKDTEIWYKNLIRGKENYVHLKSVGTSILGRNLPVLDIFRGEKKQKPIIVLLTRQHPPEVTGFFAFQTFLKTILKENKVSEEFLKKYRILAFPIMNPDGVDLGHWRHNAGGIDTNRDWSKYNQPEIRQVVKFITKESKRNKSKIILGLDFHSTYHDVFYTNKIRKETTLPNFIEDWFTALEANIPNYKVNEVASDSTKPVSKGWFLYGQNATGITYEIGDETPRDKITLIGKVTAEQMMKVLLKTTINK